jgi:hypothetical protein
MAFCYLSKLEPNLISKYEFDSKCYYLIKIYLNLNLNNIYLTTHHRHLLLKCSFIKTSIFLKDLKNYF